MADAPIVPPERDQRKPSRTWLYASIALNLLLGGLLLGGVIAERSFDPLRGRPDAHRPPPMAMRDIGFAFMRALPDERRTEISKQMKSQFGEMRPLFDESIAARKQAFALLEQDSITPEQLKAAFSKVQAIDAKAQSRAADFFAQMAAGLPAAERRVAVAKMRERWAARENMRMRWKGDEDDRRGPPRGDGPPPMGMGEGGPPPMGEGPPPPPPGE